MSFSRETVVGVLILCIAINFFCVTSYLIGHYRTLGSSGLIFDILLGFETTVTLVSHFMLLSALQSSPNPAHGPTHAEVVQKLSNFLNLNTGTIIYCCVVHIGASHFVAQHVRVYGATSAQEEQAVRDSVFSQLAVFYVLLALAKGAILYNIQGFYKEFKDNPPIANVVYILNPLANLGVPAVFVNVNRPPQGSSTTATQ